MNLNQIEIPSTDNNHIIQLIQLPKVVGQETAISCSRSRRANPFREENENETLQLNLENLSSGEFDESIELYNFENTSASQQMRYLYLNNESSNRTTDEQSFLNANGHSRQIDEENIPVASSSFIE